MKEFKYKLESTNLVHFGFVQATGKMIAMKEAIKEAGKLNLKNVKITIK